MYQQSEKNSLNSNISSTRPHNMVNFGPLTAEIGWLASFGHPSKFQRVSHLGFVTAPTSLSGSQPNFARCLAVPWAGTLRIGNFVSCKIHFASKSCVLLYWQRYCTALEQWASAKLLLRGIYKEWNYGTFAPRHF